VNQQQTDGQLDYWISWLPCTNWLPGGGGSDQSSLDACIIAVREPRVTVLRTASSHQRLLDHLLTQD